MFVTPPPRTAREGQRAAAHRVALVLALVFAAGACSSRPAKPPAQVSTTVIFQEHGQGSRLTRTFSADAAWELHYEFSCDAADSNFVISRVDNGDPARAPLVKKVSTGMSGQVHVAHAGRRIALRVESGCDWSLWVLG